MKKVLVLAAAALLFAAPAMAAISGTAHDLSTAGAGTDELCVFCHTPHGGQTGGIAPLWNRSATTTAGSVYQNASLTAAAAAVTVADVDATDAALCLSCHDGASMNAVLINEPNAATMNYAALGNIPGTSNALLLDGANGLSNDHPIGFDYVAAAGADLELDSKGNVEGKPGMAGALTYGGGNDMWCSSCHDVHGVAGVATFLRVSNAGSNLCLSCHIK